MPIRRVIRDGDSVAKLAEKHGLFPETVWNHPDNAELKAKREDMNVLQPGDVVMIPDKSQKQVSASTGASHRFKRKGVPSIYRIQLFDLDEPRASQDYTFTVDGKTVEGQTDPEGVLEETVPPRATEAAIVIGPDHFELEVLFGHLRPITDLSGVQQRLANLGFDCGDEDGELNEQTENAIREFQDRFDLMVSGTVDDATRDKLEELHDNAAEIPDDEGKDTEDSDA